MFHVILSVLAVHGAIALYVFLLRRYFAKPREVTSSVPDYIADPKVLYAQYKRMIILSLLGYVVLVGLFAYATLPFWYQAVPFYLKLLGRGGELVPIEPVIFVVVSIFVSLVACLFLVSFFERAYFSVTTWDGTRNRQQYDSVMNRLFGLDSARANRVLMPILTVSILLGAGLVTDFYIRLTPQAIVLNPFLSMSEKSCAYSDITAIYDVEMFRAPAGNMSHRRHLAFRCRDGELWRLHNMPNTRPRVIANLMETLSLRSGQPIQRVEQIDR